MRRILASILFVPVLVFVHACSIDSARAATLRDGAAVVCHRDQSLLVSSLPDGRFRLNYQIGDSAQLVRTLHDVLSPHADKLVMVRLDTNRGGALRWIVSAIESNGGQAYKPDTVCIPLNLGP
ncbi:MAG TPA: hypothetical protein VK636_23205 [Gemmatimonadaceae bacterium]|nr:hypothetical protein [Gemmatimonadaceae bacterium]